MISNSDRFYLKLQKVKETQKRDLETFQGFKNIKCGSGLVNKMVQFRQSFKSFFGKKLSKLLNFILNYFQSFGYFNFSFLKWT